LREMATGIFNRRTKTGVNDFQNETYDKNVMHIGFL